MTSRAALLVSAFCATLFFAVPAPGEEPDSTTEVTDLRSSDVAVRLTALRSLADLPRSYLISRRSSLRPALAKLLAHDPAAAVRGVAARVLARTDEDAALPLLTAAMTTERDPEAERLLAAACAELSGEPARSALGRLACDGADPRRGALAVEAIGFLPGAAGLEELTGILDAAPHWAVAAGACLGLGHVADARAVPPLIARMRHPDPGVRSAARESLVLLTGEDLGTDAREWETWWGVAKNGFRVDPKPGDAPSLRMGRTADRPAGDGDATFARFFGVEIRRRRVAFLVDYSQSMWGARRAKAEEELVAAVKGMPSTSTFAVVLFNDKVWWFRGGPLPARPQEKLDLVGYLAEQKTVSYTNIYDALEDALGLAGIGPSARDPAPGLDELVILSDGNPNRGKITQAAKILDAIRALDAGRVVIDAVALGDGPGELLPELARQNGGKFVVCPFAK